MCWCVKWGRTTKLLGPPVDVNSLSVTLLSVGSYGCAETLAVPTRVTAETTTNNKKLSSFVLQGLPQQTHRKDLAIILHQTPS